jgi:hypothetical protein
MERGIVYRVLSTSPSIRRKEAEKLPPASDVFFLYALCMLSEQSTVKL